MGVGENIVCYLSGAVCFFTLTWVDRKISHISEIPHAASYGGDEGHHALFNINSVKHSLWPAMQGGRSLCRACQHTHIPYQKLSDQYCSAQGNHIAGMSGGGLCGIRGKALGDRTERKKELEEQ